MTAVLLLLASAMGWAQRGGGARGGGFAAHGGMHPGAGIHAGGGFRGPNHFAGGGSFSSGPRSGFHPGNGFHHPGNGFHHPGHGPLIIIHDPRFNGRFRAGFYSGYPYYYGWYGSPFWWDWANSSYDSQNDNSYAQYQANAEISRLSDEVQDLREEQQARQYQPAPPTPPPASQTKSEAKQSEDLPVVLVFLDKRIQEVKNYAVANEMLVVLEGNRRKKYPLADIDLAATMKLNDERGVDFQVPNPVISQ